MGKERIKTARAKEQRAFCSCAAPYALGLYSYARYVCASPIATVNTCVRISDEVRRRKFTADDSFDAAVVRIIIVWSPVHTALNIYRMIEISQIDNGLWYGYVLSLMVKLYPKRYVITRPVKSANEKNAPFRQQRFRCHGKIMVRFM
jgi:hypothetical protein